MFEYVLKWDVSQNIAFYHRKNDNLVKSGTLFLLNTTTCQLSQHWISANDFQTKVITCNIQQSSSTTSSTNWNFSNRLKFHREKQVVVVSNPFPHKQHVASSSCTAGTIKHVEVPNQISWRYTHIHIYTYIPIICIDVYNIYICIYICSFQPLGSGQLQELEIHSNKCVLFRVEFSFTHPKQSHEPSEPFPSGCALELVWKYTDFSEHHFGYPV